MIKQIIVGCFVIGGISLSAFAAQTLTSEQESVLAKQCEAILTQYASLDNLTPQQKTVVIPILTQCYEYNVCQNSALANVDGCAKKLALWYAKKSEPVIPTIATMPQPVVAPAAAPPAHPFNFNPTAPGPVAPVAPIHAPTTIVVTPTQTPSTPQKPATPPNQPAKSNINWF